MTLTETDSFCRILLDQATIGVCVRRRDGAYLMCNPAFSRIFALGSGCLAGLGDAQVFPSEIRRRVVSAFDGVLDSGEAQDFPVEVETGEGWISLHVTAFPLTTTDGLVFAVGAMFSRAGERAQLRPAIDAATGAWTCARFEDAAIVEMARGDRYGHPVSLLGIEIDDADLDRIDENEARLAEVVREVGGGIRKIDGLAHFGAGKLFVLAPNTRVAEASRLAEKIRATISVARFSSPKPVTISVGVAEYRRGEALDYWLDRAIRALGVARDGGRNRVVADRSSSQAAPGSIGKPMSVMQLVWRDNYLSGHPLIDTQHRELFALANRLLDLVSTAGAKAETLEVVGRLVEETVNHFADEESIQCETSFPGAARHADEHARLLAKAMRLKQYVVKGTMSPLDLFQFMAHEVISEHLLGADREFSDFINRLDVPTIQ